MRACVVLVVLSACGEAIDADVDYDNAIAFAGPCTSHVDGADFQEDYTFTYVDGTLAAIHKVYVNAHDRIPMTYDTTWTWSPNDTLASVRYVETSGLPRTLDWVFGGAEVTVTWEQMAYERYDGASFAFLPTTGSRTSLPLAEIGLLYRRGVDFTWDVSDPRRPIRTGTDGELATFELDASGRLVAMAIDRPDSWVDDEETFAYEDGRLRYRTTSDASDTEEWRYDRGGNVRFRVFGSRHELYDYSCW